MLNGVPRTEVAMWYYEYSSKAGAVGVPCVRGPGSGARPGSLVSDRPGSGSSARTHLLLRRQVEANATSRTVVAPCSRHVQRDGARAPGFM